jgi:dTDP-4-dehydrorhamnose reductase
VTLKLIVGGDGVIGRAVSENWRLQGTLFHSTTRNKHQASDTRPFLDLEYPFSPPTIDDYSVVILLAAKTSTNWCEAHPRESHLINVDRTLSLAKYYSERGSHIIFLSSTQVFDGSRPYYSPLDSVNPVTEYGRQKVAAEKAVMGLRRSTILRVSKIDYPESPILVEWKRKLVSGQSIQPLSDVFISLVNIEEVVKAINEIIVGQKCGILHLRGSAEISYADYAMHLCKTLDIQAELVEPCSNQDNRFILRHSSLSES